MRDEPERLLAEILREAERAVDQQLDAARELDDKSEHMIAWVVALIGAIVAGTAYLGGTARAVTGSLPMAGALLFAMAAIVAFLDAYVGIWNQARFQLGPDPAWLAEKANDPSWTPRTHLVNVIVALQTYHGSNAAMLESSSRSHRMGLWFAFASSTLGIGGVLYLLG